VPQRRPSKSLMNTTCKTDAMRRADIRQDTIHAVIAGEKPAYVAECLELAVVTQGKTLDEVVENLRQALALHLQDEDMATLGLAEYPRLQIVYDTTIFGR